jgi:hypothetical protein
MKQKFSIYNYQFTMNLQFENFQTLKNYLKIENRKL